MADTNCISTKTLAMSINLDNPGFPSRTVYFLLNFHTNRPFGISNCGLCLFIKFLKGHFTFKIFERMSKLCPNVSPWVYSLVIEEGRTEICLNICQMLSHCVVVESLLCLKYWGSFSCIKTVYHFKNLTISSKICKKNNRFYCIKIVVVIFYCIQPRAPPHKDRLRR